MSVFQLVFVVFCATQMCTSVLRFKRSRNPVALVFASGWLTSVVLLLNPTMATELAMSIGIGRGADLVLYTLSFVFLWGHYQHYVRYKRVEDNLTTIVRELAIAQARDQRTE